MTDDDRVEIEQLVARLLKTAIRDAIQQVAGDRKAPTETATEFPSIGYSCPPVSVCAFPGDGSPGWIARDVIEKDMYGIQRVPFKPGDVLIDVGAHIGLVSLYTAALYPGIRALAFEPNRANYEHLLKSIALNPKVAGVEPHFLAITGDGRDVEVGVDEGNSGGATIYGVGGKYRNRCHSLTLEGAMDRYDVKTIKLLKLDVERAEYEILHAFTRWDAVEYLALETHADGGNERAEFLLKKVRAHIPEDHLFLSEA